MDTKENKEIGIIEGNPVVVCYGGGVDSTAVLVGLHKFGYRPDLVIFADTGGEKPETYAHLDLMDRWLSKVGFPKITRVKYEPPFAAYKDLEGNCLDNEALPSIAFGRHSCAAKWKVKPIDDFIAGISRGPRKRDAWYRAVHAWGRGRKVSKLIGFNSDPNDARRASKDAFAKPSKSDASRYTFSFPLISWGWSRNTCIKEIAAAGIPVPQKSACFFCPSSKACEISALRDNHQDLFERAVKIEENYLNGHNNKGGSTIGLGRKFTWAAFKISNKAAA